MTTTGVPLGIDEGKPSSRVIRPPGGASSFSLGIDSVEDRPLRQAASQGRADTASPASVKPPIIPDNPPIEGQSPASSVKVKTTSHSRIFGDPEPSSPASGRDLARGASPFNPITGEIYPGFERLVSNLDMAKLGKSPGKDGKNAGNPITGAGACQPKPQQQQQTQPSTKVRQPPGGFSHGIF